MTTKGVARPPVRTTTGAELKNIRQMLDALSHQQAREYARLKTIEAVVAEIREGQRSIEAALGGLGTIYLQQAEAATASRLAIADASHQEREQLAAQMQALIQRFDKDMDTTGVYIASSGSALGGLKATLEEVLYLLRRLDIQRYEREQEREKAA